MFPHPPQTDNRIYLGTTVHLGEVDSEDGMGAAADVIHGCAGRGAVGIAETDQVL